MSASVGILDVLGRQTIHPFPARMAPALALDALSQLPKGATVLDPMVGSGTVVALARAQGYRAIGFDVDPLAALVARVWTRTLHEGDVRRAASRALQLARKMAVDLATRDAYPRRSDVESCAFLRYWFDGRSRRQLTALSTAITHISSEETREALWCAFSRMIIAKQAGVSLALDLAHSRPHRSFDRAPRQPFQQFPIAVERVISGCVRTSEKRRGPLARVEVGDVREMPLPDRCIDLVVTSPPYLNAIDYLRCSKFSLVWMGYSLAGLRAIRSTSIGTEVGAPADATQDANLEGLPMFPTRYRRSQAVLRRYVADTERAMREVARVLRSQGRAILVVGENTVRGTYIPTGKLVAQVATRAGLRLVGRRARQLPANRRYLPPPGGSGTAMDSRMRREVILAFERID